MPGQRQHAHAAHQLEIPTRAHRMIRLNRQHEPLPQRAPPPFGAFARICQRRRPVLGGHIDVRVRQQRQRAEMIAVKMRNHRRSHVSRRHAQTRQLRLERLAGADGQRGILRRAAQIEEQIALLMADEQRPDRYTRPPRGRRVQNPRVHGIASQRKRIELHSISSLSPPAPVRNREGDRPVCRLNRRLK